MPRKKSVKKSARDFLRATKKIDIFLNVVSLKQSDEHISWLHNYAIIYLYREFESLILDALVGAINNDISTISSTTNVNFPAHLSAEVCEFLITGTGYFDFKGRDGLIKTLKKFIPDNHYLIKALKNPVYRDALEQLTALRNFSTHESRKSKRDALKAIKLARIDSSGAWLKKNGRFQMIIGCLNDLASEISRTAPY
jgi:hypothetical protein